MSSLHRLFRINVGFLIGGQIGVSHDFHFDSNQVELDSDFLIQNLQGVAHISRNPQGLLLEARFRGETEATCGRCLQPFTLPLEWEFIESYVFPRKRKEADEPLVPMDGYLDLSELVHDYALLAIPSRLVCRPDCQGLCPICGANRNETTCQHGEEEAPPPSDQDSPFATLKDLLD